MVENNKYVLGRGEVYFARLDASTGVLSGERYLGNTPEFNLSFQSEELDHYNSDRGVKELDKTMTLQVTRSGTITTDNISKENVALYFLGSADALTVAQTTVTDEAVGSTGIQTGLFYQLGVSANNPGGARKIIYPGVSGTLFVLKKGSTPLVAGTDYNLNAELGRLEILKGGSIVDGDTTIKATYTVAASKRDRMVSGSTSIQGAIRFIAYNPTGDNIDYYLPSVLLSPNGDFALKGDEWQKIQFNVKVLKPTNGEALYADGRAVTP